MDPRERLNDDQEALRMALDARQSIIHTGMPGIVVSYNAGAMTAVIQPAIMAQVRDQAGNWNNVKLPLLLDCPVFFPSGGGFTLTFPIEVGAEVFVALAERCIDAWWQSGGVQPQTELRMHDLSDGFCFPKVWSQPKKLNPVPSTSNAQLRSDDGSLYIELASGHVCNIVAPGGLNITGPVAITGALTATGDVTAGQGGADQVALQTHKHGTGTPAAGTSSPTAGT